MFIRPHFHIYQKPLEDDGDDNGGGGDTTLLDRGDDIEPKVEPKTDEVDPEVEDEAKKLLEKKTDEGEQPRDPTGKFAKKERDVPDHVPKARFDDAVGKERAAREAAEARAAALEALVRKETRSDEVAKAEEAIEGLEAKHTKLILDGEHEAAAKVMREIRHAERQIATFENEEKLTRATSQAVEQVRMDAAIARLESDHPVLNDESEEFDQDLVDLVLAEQMRLINEKRMSPSAALTAAGDKIMKKFSAVQPKAKDKDEDEEEAKPAGLNAAKDASSRKADQVAKNLDTANNQPPKSSAAGKDSDKAGMKDSLPDLDKLTPEEFEALPASAKAKMRGDFV